MKARMTPHGTVHTVAECDQYDAPHICKDVVVIDPEDPEQVQRLTAELTIHGGWREIQAALRSLIGPPKPEEPTGLGAVVEDDRGLRWVRVNEHLQAEWRPADAASTKSFRKYAGIDAVKVLSEGVR